MFFICPMRLIFAESEDTKMDYRFEICANSVESCLAAQEGGAHRVELCAGIPEGGTTPSYGEIVVARRLLDIRLHVIIRPRGGDFLYSPVEVDTMVEDIRMARQAGADGVVFGCLDENGDLDMPAMRRLMDAARGCSVTFHRAFDRCRNPFGVMEQLVELGVDSILTSGQQPTAPEGAAMIKELVERAGGRISILAGCGVNEGNIRQLAEATGVKEFHFSARESVKSRMKLANPDVLMGAAGVDEYTRQVTTAARVRATIERLG